MQLGAEEVVQIGAEFVTPAVEGEIEQPRCRTFQYRDRAVVAGPRVVGRSLIELNTLQAGASLA